MIELWDCADCNANILAGGTNIVPESCPHCGGPIQLCIEVSLAAEAPSWR